MSGPLSTFSPKTACRILINQTTEVVGLAGADCGVGRYRQIDEEREAGVSRGAFPRIRYCSENISIPVAQSLQSGSDFTLDS